MAKVVFSALISDIRGRLGGTVYSFCRGVHYLKTHNPSPRDPNTETQQQHRATFAYYTGLWSHLSDTIKLMWDRYGSQHNPPITGYARFLKTNIILFAARHPDLKFREYPLLSVSTPRSISGFTATPLDSRTTRLAWQIPQTTTDYVQSYQSLDKNYVPGYNKYWSQIYTVRSDVGEIIHSHTYPVGTRIYYRLRTIDSSGCTSPKTHVIAVIVPP